MEIYEKKGNLFGDYEGMRSRLQLLNNTMGSKNKIWP